MQYGDPPSQNNFQSLSPRTKALARPATGSLSCAFAVLAIDAGQPGDDVSGLDDVVVVHAGPPGATHRLHDHALRGADCLHGAESVQVHHLDDQVALLHDGARVEIGHGQAALLGLHR